MDQLFFIFHQNIIKYIVSLRKLTLSLLLILDLSHNNFCGSIPPCLGKMAFVEYGAHRVMSDRIDYASPRLSNMILSILLSVGHDENEDMIKQEENEDQVESTFQELQ